MKKPLNEYLGIADEKFWKGPVSAEDFLLFTQIDKLLPLTVNAPHKLLTSLASAERARLGILFLNVHQPVEARLGALDKINDYQESIQANVSKAYVNFNPVMKNDRAAEEKELLKKWLGLRNRYEVFEFWNSALSECEVEI